MKQQKITRKDKIAITKVVKKQIAGNAFGGQSAYNLKVIVGEEAYQVQIRNDQIFLPSGQSFEIPGRHVC